MPIMIDDMFDFLIFEKGESIKHNEIEKKALIIDNQDKVNVFDNKQIITDYKINTGDIIQYQGDNWLVITEIEKNIKTFRARIRKAEHIIKTHLDGVLYYFPAIIEASTQSIAENSKIAVVEGNIKVTIQENPMTNKITYNNTFIKMGSKWRVNGFTSEHKGLKYLYCSKIEFSESDDRLEEISDRWLYEPKHSYILSVEPKEIILNENQTQQITTTITDNNNPVINPAITYTSDDTNIVMVDSNGLVTAKLEGTCNISISFSGLDGKVYSKDIPVIVKKIITDSITYDLLPTASMGLVIKKSNTNTFTGKKYNNGVEVAAVFDFAVDLQGLTTSQVSIVETTDQYIKIKNVEIDTTTPVKTIIVRCKEKGKTIWDVEKIVELKGIWG